MKTAVLVALVGGFLFSNEDPQIMLNKQYKAYISAQAFTPGQVEKYHKRITNLKRPLPKSTKMFLEANVDWEAYAQSTFGLKNWKALSNKQKKKFKRLLQKVHIKKYGKYFSPDVKFSMHFRSPTEYKLLRGFHFAKVETTVSSLRNDVEFDIDFIFRRGEKRWALCDVYIDGISKSKNYRRQVKKIFKKKGFKGVMEAFRNALKKS